MAKSTCTKLPNKFEEMGRCTSSYLNALKTFDMNSPLEVKMADRDLSRLAVIDMGSNSFKLFIYEHIGDQWLCVHKEKEKLKIGKALNHNQRIPAAKMAEIEQCLIRYKNKCDLEHTPLLGAVATSAFRNAENKDDLYCLTAKLKLSFDIISGEEEGRLGYLSATHGAPEIAVIDMGSWSLQLSARISAHSPIEACSFELGYQDMFDGFFSGAMNFHRGYLKYEGYLESQFGKNGQNLPPWIRGKRKVLLLGGKSFSKYIRGSSGEDSPLTYAEIVEFIQRLKAFDEFEYQRFIAAHRRAPKLLSGLAFLIFFMRATDYKTIHISSEKLALGKVLDHIGGLR